MCGNAQAHYFLTSERNKEVPFFIKANGPGCGVTGSPQFAVLTLELVQKLECIDENRPASRSYQAGRNELVFFQFAGLLLTEGANSRAAEGSRSEVNHVCTNHNP